MEEEILSIIIHGCKLAQNLETHLPHLATIQPPIDLFNSCNEILKVFQCAVNRLMNLSIDFDHHHLHPSSILSSMNTNYSIPHDQAEPRPMLTEFDASVQEWLKSSYTQAIETAAATAQFSSISNDVIDVHHHSKNPFISSRMLQEQQTQELGLEMSFMNNIVRTSDAGHHRNELTTPDEANAATRTAQPAVVQRSRKRKDVTNKRTVRVAGPRIGNMEIPPDDGFTWRKYGQKEILGSNFPRGYYRCTHKNFFGCEAKKQVQRLDMDPNTFEVTYYGIHTCQMGGGGGSRSGGVLSSSSSSSQLLPADEHEQYHSSNMVVELVDNMFNTTTTTTSGGGGRGRGNNTINMDSIFISSFAQAQAQEQAYQ